MEHVVESGKGVHRSHSRIQEREAPVPLRTSQPLSPQYPHVHTSSQPTAPAPKAPQKISAQASTSRDQELTGNHSAQQSFPLQPVSAPPHPGITLQQQAGNRAVHALLRGVGLRPKLTVSQPDDPEEVEANATADSIMRSQEHPTSACSCANDDEPCDECAAHGRSKQKVHRSPSNPAPIHGNGHAPQIPSSIHTAVSEPGQPLDSTSRDFFEPRFKHDFSQVRIHTSPQAGASAQSIQANAYTLGTSIVFAPGQYSPTTTGGRTLMAHELTHVVQGARERGLSSRSHQSPPAIHRDPAPVVDDSAVKSDVDIIVKALKGITTANDSHTILQQFQGKSSDFMRALMVELKSRASDNDETPDGMITWLFGDMTAEDRRSLRSLLMANHVLEDLGPILIKEIVTVLSGILSDGAPVFEILGALGGADIDNLLLRLETQTKKSQSDSAVYLFDNIDRVTASKLRLHFIEHGGPRSWVYVAAYTSFKIADLIGGLLGYVSHSESTIVVNNFTDIQVPAIRQLTQQKLDERTRASDSDSAENRLMKKLDQGDYEKIQQLPGLTLRKFDLKPTALDKVASGAKWAVTIAEWTTCGVVGIATGLLSAAWDILKGLWDVTVAIKHLLMCLIYLLSGGSVGSEDLLAVKDFFSGLGKIFKEPGKVWDQMWGQLKAEFTTIEGPLADCKRAEFVVRKFIGVAVNVLLVFVGGYGIAKSAAEAGVAFAELAEEVGIVRALGQTAARLGRSALKFVAELPGQAAEILQALRKPLEILFKVRTKINAILLAVDNEGVYAVLRERAAGLLENEKKFWTDNRERWKGLGQSGQTAQVSVEEQAGIIQNAADNQQVPTDPGAVPDVEAKAGKVENQANELEGEMKSNPDTTADPQTTAKPGDFTPDQIKAANQALEERIADPKNVRPAATNSGYDLEVDLGDGQTFKRKFDGTWCLSRNPVECGFTVSPKVAQAADTFLAKIDLEELIDAAIELKEKQSGGTFSDEQISALREQFRKNPDLILDVLEHNAETPQIVEGPEQGGNTTTGRGGSAPGDAGRLGKDLSRSQAMKAGDSWVCEEPKFTYTNRDGSTGEFFSDVGMTGASEGGPYLIESELGPNAGLTPNQVPGYNALLPAKRTRPTPPRRSLRNSSRQAGQKVIPCLCFLSVSKNGPGTRRLKNWFPTISHWK